MKRVILDQYTQSIWCESVGKKITETLVETSNEVTDSNMEIAAKDVHSISNNNSDIKLTYTSP